MLGVLVEKALTTPEQYPLTLNAAVNGANQKSNRDPVLDALRRRGQRGARRPDRQGAGAQGVSRQQPGRQVLPHRHVDAEDRDRAARAARRADAARPADAGRAAHARRAHGGYRVRRSGWRSCSSRSMQRGMVERVPSGRGFRAERVGAAALPRPAPARRAVGAARAPALDGMPRPDARGVGRSASTALEATVRRLEQQLRNLAEKLGESAGGMIGRHARRRPCGQPARAARQRRRVGHGARPRSTSAVASVSWLPDAIRGP